MSDLLTREHHRMLQILDNADSMIARHIALHTGRLPKTPRLGHRRGTAIAPRLALSDYLPATPSLPARVHRGLPAGYRAVLGNDQWGDCGEAMTLHGIEGICHAAGQTPPPFVTQDALNLYSAVTGFDPSQGAPGDNPTDQGTDNTQLINHWETAGVPCAADRSVHKIVGSVQINPGSDAECQTAIYEFGALFCAWALPVTAQGARTWDVQPNAGEDGQPASWGYHDTVALAYDGPTIDLDSWGVYIPVSAPFRREYAAGFFAVLTEDMLNRRGVSPTGLDWTALNTAFANLNQQEPAPS